MIETCGVCGAEAAIGGFCQNCGAVWVDGRWVTWQEAQRQELHRAWPEVMGQEGD